MTNEEKATHLSQEYFPDEENIWARANTEALKCKSACMEMAQWKDEQYKVLIDYIVEFLNDSWYDCETFSECMPEWCEKNCGSHNPNFNAECIKNWIKKQNENKK